MTAFLKTSDATAIRPLQSLKTALIYFMQKSSFCDRKIKVISDSISYALRLFIMPIDIKKIL